jgi:hypothetical protein
MNLYKPIFLFALLLNWDNLSNMILILGSWMMCILGILIPLGNKSSLDHIDLYYGIHTYKVCVFFLVARVLHYFQIETSKSPCHAYKVSKLEVMVC